MRLRGRDGYELHIKPYKEIFLMLKNLRIYNWNAERISNAEDEDNKLRISFDVANVQGLDDFVSSFQHGKQLLESPANRELPSILLFFVSAFNCISKWFRKAKG